GIRQGGPHLRRHPTGARPAAGLPRSVPRPRAPHPAPRHPRGRGHAVRRVRRRRRAPAQPVRHGRARGALAGRLPFRSRLVGRVRGLRKPETIRAVRFMGPVGYVVTFRQTDPLYVIDRSDPTEPVAAGELKIPGFSAYLHPVAEGRLIGVGQDADPETGATKGLQISLFDVTDPTAPARLDTFMPYPPLDGREGHVCSPVEWDHRAFTNTDGAAFVPFEGWSWREGGGQEEAMFGVIAVSWDGDTLDGSRVLPVFEGKPGGDEWSLSPQRVVARGEVVYAVGHDGISVIDLASGEIVDTVRY